MNVHYLYGIYNNLLDILFNLPCNILYNDCLLLIMSYGNTDARVGVWYTAYIFMGFVSVN